MGHDPGSGGMVWIRLRDPDRYLACAPAQANSAIRRFLLPFAAVLGALGIGSLRRYASRVRTHADEVRWNRETFGWDLAWSTMWLDRPGDRFVELLERYRREAAP